MTPDMIRERLAAADQLAARAISRDDRANVAALAALTEAVLHLADVIARDRVF